MNMCKFLSSLKFKTTCLLLLSVYCLSSAQNVTEGQISYSQSETAPQDATHIIKKGDTLWDLAFRFLSDPFRWPQIWNLNPYIKNPDLIYPGNSLLIPGRNEINSSAQVKTVLTSHTRGALDKADSLKSVSLKSEVYAGDSLLLSTLRRKNLLSSDFFASVPFLWTERDPSGRIYPGNATVDKPSNNESYQLFAKISITLQKDASYSKGDTVDIYKSLRFVKFQSSKANLIVRVGRARVIELESKKIYAELFEMSDPIKGKEYVANTKNFVPIDIEKIIEPTVNISAGVFERAEETEKPYPFQTLILDRGSSDGIKLGDVFAVYSSKDSKSASTLSVIGCIAHVNQKSSSLVIVNMSDENLKAGDKATLIRRSLFREGES